MADPDVHSRLWRGERRVGVASGDAPGDLAMAGSMAVAVVPCEAGWLAFDASVEGGLRLVASSPPGPRGRRVSAVVGRPSRDEVLSAVGGGVEVWRRMVRVRRLRPSAKADGAEGAAGARRGQIVDGGLLGLGGLVLALYEDGMLRVWDDKAADDLQKRLQSEASFGGAGDANVVADTDDSASDGSGDSEGSDSSEHSGDSDSTGAERSREEARRGTFRPVSEVYLGDGRTPSCIVHPSTYLNKVVVGTAEGFLQIRNIRTNKLVFESEVAKGCRINKIVQSPAVDVVGLGLSDGRVIVHNLRLDKTIASFKQADGAVTALSFCSSSVVNPPVLVSGSSRGQMAIWNLEEKTLHSIVKGGHGAAVTTLHFVPGLSTFVSAGADNAVRQWVLDQLDGTARLVRERSGHRKPPTHIRYYAGDIDGTAASGADARICEILSAGSDKTFRVTHTALEQQNREMSQGSLASKSRALNVDVDTLRLPKIIAFDASERRHGDWPDVVTAHEGDHRAYLWDYERRALASKVLPLPAPNVVTAVALSTCGNYALVGGSNGDLLKFNVQSGFSRGEFPKKGNSLLPEPPMSRGTANSNSLTDAERGGSRTRRAGADDKRRRVGHRLNRSMRVGLGKDFDLGDNDGLGAADDTGWQREHAHTGAVYGVHVDGLNGCVVSCGADGEVRFWNFDDHKEIESLSVGSPVSSTAFHKDSSLLAVSCDDHGVRVIDIVARRIVRRFRPAAARITDMCFSGDARWLIVASMDCSVKVWDVPAGRCVDWVVFAAPVTSLALSPGDNYLATTHADSNAIFLFSNRTMFDAPGAIEGNLTSEPSGPCRLDRPALTSAEDGATTSKRASTEQAIGDSDSSDSEDSDTESVVELKAVKRKADDEDVPPAKRRFDSDKIVPAEGCSVTLSGVPRSQWTNLRHLDTIAARNKPKEPPKAPEKAPFFLPTLPGLTPKFIAPAAADSGADATPDVAGDKPAGKSSSGKQEETEEADWNGGWGGGAWGDDGDDEEGDEEDSSELPTSKILKSGVKRARSEFARRLLLAQKAVARNPVVADEADSDGEAAGAVSVAQLYSASTNASMMAVSDLLASLSPAAVDSEVRALCLGPSDDDGRNLLLASAQYFLWCLRSGARFELAQAHLNLFLKIHGATISRCEELKSQIRLLRVAQKEAWSGLQDLLQNSLCLIHHFSKLH